MSIFEKDGADVVLNIGKARDELAAARGISNENERKKTVAEITAGALLDIAASLRPLAAEVREAQATAHLAQGGVSYLPTEPDENEAPAWMLLDVGSWVEPATDEQPEHVGRIVELGVREDEPSARVQWYTRQGKPVAEGWSFLATLFEADSLDLSVDNGLRAEAAEHEADIAGEPESSTMIAEGIPAHVESDDERRERVNRERDERMKAAKANPEPEPEAPVEPAGDPMFSIGADDDASPAAEMRAGRQATVDIVDDIDSDFDGDHHLAADDALAVLKANEKARKKAAGGKSGKAKKGGKK